MSSLILLTALVAPSATHRSENFIVEAPTPEIARQIADRAERDRRRIAKQWLGVEMPAWPRPCPIRVDIDKTGSSSSTQFDFRDNHVNSMKMQLQGDLDRVINSGLPHEIAHTIFADDIGQPIPRWADEGMAALCEDDDQQDRYRRMLREFIKNDRVIPLRELFEMMDYPRDVMILYAQGHSVAEFLVKQKGRKTYLAFVDRGMRRGWDHAVTRYYGYANVDALEDAWRETLEVATE